MNKSSLIGGNLVEYIIPIAVVGLVVGLGTYSLYAKGSLTGFFTATTGGYIDQQGKLSFGSDNKNSSLTPDIVDSATTVIPGGFLIPDGSGKLDIKSGCVNYECNISFGQYNLTGIPQDPQTFIETSGPAIYTEKIIANLNIVAQALENIADGDTEVSEASEILRKIAYLTKNVSSTGVFETNEPVFGISSKQSEIESKLSQIKGHDPFNSRVISDVSSIIYDYNTNNYEDQPANMKNINHLAMQFQQIMGPKTKYASLTKTALLLVDDIKNVNETFVTSCKDAIDKVNTDLSTNSDTFDYSKLTNDIRKQTASNKTDIRGKLIEALSTKSTDN